MASERAVENETVVQTKNPILEKPRLFCEPSQEAGDTHHAHNASPAQAGLSASRPQTEKLGSRRPPDGFVVSPFALVAPLSIYTG
ncbi:uncharacterized [Tachysurus ichikawai]